MKTIKELSDAIGISKVSIYKLLKRDDIKAHVFKRDNISLIDETGEQLIRDYYNRQRNETISDIADDVLTNSKPDSKDDLIRFLQEQLKERDNQINGLINALTNSQKLQATQYITDNRTDSAVKATCPDTVRKNKEGFPNSGKTNKDFRSKSVQKAGKSKRNLFDNFFKKG